MKKYKIFAGARESSLMSSHARARPRLTPYPLRNMGRIADQLSELIKSMEESDRRLQRLIDDHVTTTTARLEELKKLNE